MISRFLQTDPNKRISIEEALDHPWFKIDGSIEEEAAQNLGSDNRKGDDSATIGSTTEELSLMAQLEAIGFDINSIIASVNSNACDQGAALWHLLLHHQKDSSHPRNSIMRQYSLDSRQDILLQKTPSQHSSVYESSLEGSFPNKISINIDVDRYVETVRTRSSSQSSNPLLTFATNSVTPGADEPLFASISVPSSVAPTNLQPVSATRGRRSLAMDAMQSSDVSTIKAKLTQNNMVSSMKGVQPNLSYGKPTGVVGSSLYSSNRPKEILEEEEEECEMNEAGDRNMELN